ncbi:hypothetical protein BSL84_29445 [Streptomyces sp. TN58]|nr:hypothetical protein BSL84_29445 [Streptomyces sp. TN58]
MAGPGFGGLVHSSHSTARSGTVQEAVRSYVEVVTRSSWLCGEADAQGVGKDPAMPAAVGFCGRVQAQACGEPLGAAGPCRFDGDPLGQFRQPVDGVGLLSGEV